MRRTPAQHLKWLSLLCGAAWPSQKYTRTLNPSGETISLPAKWQNLVDKMADTRYNDFMAQSLTRKTGAPPRPDSPAGAPHRSSIRRGSSLGLSLAGTNDLIRAVRKGLPFKALIHFSTATQLSPSRIASALEIPERTLARRRSEGRFAPDESERLLRISTVFEKAVALFDGNVAVALTWLTTPKKALGRNTPWDYSRFEPGAREVESLIGRLEHGVFT
jgi:putative toxin-antitoxin system antitoxin component (TIGR02293 family)